MRPVLPISALPVFALLRRGRQLLICAAILLQAAGGVSGRSFLSAASDRLARRTSEPYQGDLSVFEYPERDARLQTERVMDLLQINRGKSVADIGAGSGWFSVRAARRIGPRGTVYAVEINRVYIRHIRQRAKAEQLANIRTILGRAGNPHLARNSVDAILILKTYHEVADPISLLRHVRRAMRPGARLGIIDKNGTGTDHGLNADVVIREANRAGLHLIAQHDFVRADGMDYFLIFEAER